MFHRLVSILFSAFLISAVAFPLASAEASKQTGYLKIKGAKQGEIKGSVSRKGVEGTTEVISMSHEVTSEQDAKAGPGPTRPVRRLHKPIRLRFYYDFSLPPLYQALATNEALSEVEYAVHPSGDKSSGSPIFTVRLTDARVSQIRIMRMGEGDDARDVVEVSFTYAKIRWTWVDNGITHEDTWEQ